MAKATEIKKVIYTLELTEDEARRLKAWFQNQIFEDETKEEDEFRETMWDALDKAGVKSL